MCTWHNYMYFIYKTHVYFMQLYVFYLQHTHVLYATAYVYYLQNTYVYLIQLHVFYLQNTQVYFMQLHVYYLQTHKCTLCNCKTHMYFMQLHVFYLLNTSVLYAVTCILQTYKTPKCWREEQTDSIYQTKHDANNIGKVISSLARRECWTADFHSHSHDTDYTSAGYFKSWRHLTPSTF